MALSKDILYKGVICNYHKILSISAEYTNLSPNADRYKTLSAKVGSYKDSTIRGDDVGSFLLLTNIRYTYGQPSAPETDKIDKVYKSLKKDPSSPFVGAEDV